MKKACTDTVHGKAQHEGQLKLSEAVAVHHLNFDVLEKVVLSLYKPTCSPDLLVRVVRMIEIFCCIVGETKKSFDAGSPGLTMSDATMMKALLLLMKLSSVTPEAYTLCHSVARICTSFENCGKLENMQMLAAYLLKVTDSQKVGCGH